MPIDWADFGVDLHLDLDSGAGRRAALEAALRTAIRSGRVAPDTRLPSSRSLAAELGLARNTVAAAYDQLVAEGYLSARTGAGTTVVGLPGGRAPTGTPPATPAPRYDLRPGSPDVGTFPVDAWLRATRRALASAPASAYDYGDPRGRIELRTALAGYLGRARGVLADPARIVVTSGYVQALALLTRVLGGPVAMEDPGLPFHRDVVRYAGAEVVPLPVDGHGARTDLLDATSPRTVVLTPAHQYPTGVTLHPTRRHAAVAWASGGDRLLVEDDYDGEFRYDRQPVGALQGTAPEHVAYVGTAAKTLGPALRLAWLVLPERLVEPVVTAKRFTDLHTGSVGQLALAALIDDHGYDRHVRSCRLRYRKRRDLLVDRIGRRHPPLGIAAGMHAYLPLSAADETRVLDRAEAYGLALGALGTHWHGAPAGHGVIVGYTTPAQSAYPAAIDALARVLSPIPSAP
ncbi:MocR-like pyridoxine biosynthesis transcription factor PdxR [Actinocatenispora rupis]|uniref:GntR family transcriptional regulator n=1 Tax=Actinocatenispora rupis TaxID=519421 RepID=A0A8J3IV05_9ACTN|nr:PLP-dependent aminotransferase family protein [Actinocatenispora rupis]GID10436.1 GntR family transcriptional regulator [Actinocatenispora rupis]